MSKQLIIMQGLPGSGKSFVWQRDYAPAFVCSADYYFRRLNPNYDNGGEGFDPSKLGEAHAECFADAMRGMQGGSETVVIDNTNLDNESIAVYVAIGKHYGYDVTICRVKCDPKIAYERNSHGVPEKAYKYLAKNFDRWRLWAPHKYGGVKVREVDNTPVEV